MLDKYDFNNVIITISNEIDKLFKSSKEWDNEDNKIIQLLRLYHTSLYQQIHYVLAPKKTKESEKELRSLIAKYVIGYVENKKIVHKGAIDIIKSKLVKFNNKKQAPVEYISKYLELYDDFMALASFRSMKHYFLYMQSIFNITVWEDTQNCFEGYYYYAGRMVLDGEVKFIEKQCPTGFGKSLSDAYMQSWIFGIDIDNDVLKVCGNDKFTDDCFQNVVNLMISERYAKVFPYFAQFECEINSMFQYCSRKDLKFSITGSSKSTNLRIITKLSDCNGVRAKYLFLDDITQRNDMSNMSRHNKDIHSFKHEWFERNYNRNEFYIIASGTTYSQFDILSYLKSNMGGDCAVKSPINKYTKVSRSDYIVPNGVSVFVCVPLLDYDTGKSTYPKKISTESALKKKEESPEEFMAMDMQQPLPPDSSPFYFTKLREYYDLPRIGELGRMDYCVASLDPKRRGKDFVSMPILFEAQDPERKDDTVFFLNDWLYDDRPMKQCIPLIVSKIIERKITRLYVERNTEECIEMLISDKLKEYGYNSCVIEEVYSTEPKDRRIMSAEGDIKSKIIFPRFGLYSQSNQIGKAMQNLYGYTYYGKVEHDDAADSLALFSRRFINKSKVKLASISSFKR